MSEQVVQTAVLTCSFGTVPCPLMVLISKITACGNNAANILDFMFPTNIAGFTMCTSPSNPAVVAALGVPQPCTPVLAAPWTPGKLNVMLRGAPALDSTSKLICAYAGVISITEAGQEKVTLK